ncbi:phage portal protein [Agrobacterium rhizogenes]|nr:phage portal protein [Rhizobium rhizogenes]NTF75125.1 phage portal protein [Rhizobium rhizogenes]NTH51519.1 phage portal protein [Rhizobium rhizogenes]NTH71103.1 phage portal protein [Rhizobium rhizogenes]
MGILSKITLGVFGQKQVEKRDAAPQPVSDPNFSIFGTIANPSNEATKLATASAAIWLISSQYAGTDTVLYSTRSGSPKPAVTNPLHDLMLNGTASMSAFELKMQLMSDLLQGECFALVEYDEAGKLADIKALPAANVSVEFLGNGKVIYRYSDPLRNYVQTVYTAAQVFHGKHRPLNGRGRSPLSLAALSVSTAVSTETAVANSAASGFKASAVLTAPGAVSDEVAGRLSKAMQEGYSGAQKAGRIVVLGDGMAISSLSSSNRENDANELRKLNAYAIASAFGVPGESVGLPWDSSWGSAQQSSIQLVQNALNPWSASLNGQLSAFLLSPSQRRYTYLANDYRHLVEGSLQDKAAAYSSLTSSGVMTLNEARAVFDLSAMDGGNDLRIPLNTGQANTASNQGAAA